MSNLDLVNAAQGLGLDVKSHSSSVSDDDAKKIIAKVKAGGVETTQAPTQTPAPKKKK